MTKRSVKSRVVDLKRLVEEDQDYLRAMVQSLVGAGFNLPAACVGERLDRGLPVHLGELDLLQVAVGVVEVLSDAAERIGWEVSRLKAVP